MVSMNLTTRGAVDITTVLVRARRGQDAFGRPAYPDDGVQLGPVQPNRDGGREVPFGPDVDAGARLPDLLDEVLVPVPVENGDGYLGRPAPYGLGNGLDVLRDG